MSVLYYGDVDDDDEGDPDVNVSNDKAGAVEDGSTIRGYDCAPCESLSQTLFDLDAEDDLLRAVENTPVSEAMNEFPSWGDTDEAAFALALNGPESPADFVSMGLLTREELSLSSWGLLYKIPMSAMDKLQELITERTRSGLLNFDVQNLVKTEGKRRAIIDEQIPAHQRTARGNLFTDEHCKEQAMRKNVVIDARNMLCVAIEIIHEFEDHMDWHLRPHYDVYGKRLYNEHFGSGNRAHYLNESLHDDVDESGFVIALCFHSDKTLIGSKESIWPMYLTILNIDPNVRKMQATRRLVAFFPVLRGDWLSGKNRRKGQAVWHLILRWVLDPLIRQLRTGFLYKKKNGTFIKVYFRLATVTVDLPEMCLMLCTYQASGSAERPNPSCTCRRMDFLKRTATCTCESELRATDHMRDILRRGDTVEAREYSFTMQEVRV